MLYVPGFDPRGALHYHRLYRDNAARQAALTGARIEVGPRRRVSSAFSGWTVEADLGPHRVRTTYEFCHWDDIVRAHWPRASPRLVLAMLAGHARALRAGLLGRALRLSRNFFFALNFPVAILYLVILLAIASGFVVRGLLAAAGLPPLAATAAGIAAAAALPVSALRLNDRLSLFWLGRIGLFSTRRAEQGVPAYDARAGLIAARIREAARNDELDELLVIGHSVGSELSLSALAAALEPPPRLGRRLGEITYLTLGTTIPMHAALPGACAFREALLRVATAPAVNWIDVSAPPDPACFALVDPVEAAGLERPAEARPQPKLASARFAHLFRPKTYRRLRRDWFHMHFLYLTATELPGTYDYFAITAGDRTLAERYAHVPSERGFTRLRGLSLRGLRAGRHLP